MGQIQTWNFLRAGEDELLPDAAKPTPSTISTLEEPPEDEFV